jgi:hypothetical protein
LSYDTNTTFIADPDDPEGGWWKTNRQAKFTATLLSGQTNSFYEIRDVQTNHSDYYSVIVSNALGATASYSSLLSVEPAVVSMATANYWNAVVCRNNLAQIALFARMSASDHDERMPQSLAAMTNSFGSPIFGWPVVLYCRSDGARVVPPDWAAVDFANTSYEVLPVAGEDLSAPFCRCKIHGFYAQASGAVIARPQFTDVRWLPQNATELKFTVFAAQTNLLEASSDLVNWTTLRTYSATNADFFFSDTNQLSRRFYRIRAE